MTASEWTSSQARLRLPSITYGLQCRPHRPKTTFAVAFLNFAGREESRMIRKLRPPELLVIPSLVFTMRSVEHTSRYGPARPRTKKRHTLRSRVGKGEACAHTLLPPPGPVTLSIVCRRLLGFVGCLVGAAVCFGVAFLTLPLLAIRPAKFALSFRHVCTMTLRSSRLTFLLALVACWLCLGKDHTRTDRANPRTALMHFPT